MKRRSFLGLVGMAPMAAVTPAVASSIDWDAVQSSIAKNMAQPIQWNSGILHIDQASMDSSAMIVDQSKVTFLANQVTVTDQSI